MNRLSLVAVSLLLSLACAPMALAGEPHYLIDNFSSPLPGAQGFEFSVDTAAPKVGLGALKVGYEFPAEKRVLDMQLPEQRWMLPAAGKLVFWLKGDGSGNELQFMMYSGQTRVEPDGKRSKINVRGVELPRIKMDFTQWKEITLDLGTTPLPADGISWLARMRIFGAIPADKKTPLPEKYQGTIELDDMRLYALAGAATPGAAVSAILLGPAVRDFTSDFAIALDARNFTANAAKIKVRMSMTDRNQNPVADRDFDLKLEGNEAKEFKLDLAPENIGLYLPPFHVSGDVISTDLPALASRIDVDVVMANSRILFENFGSLNGNWLTRGYHGIPDRPIIDDLRTWSIWTMGEAARAVAWTQTSAKISRVDIERPANADAKKFPPDRYAMKFEYDGEAAAYTGIDRYIPGDAFKFGMWVKGDGSNSRLLAEFLDYSDMSDFYAGGWKRTEDGVREICRLNFTDWRYFEVPLPGNGVGANTPRGSTEAIDFPIELTALLVLPEQPPRKPDPAKPLPPQSGTVLIGPMFADTQQSPTTTLAAMIGYDDPVQNYAPALGASVSIQNAWRVGSRKVQADWTLADKNNQPIVTGKQMLDIPAGEIRSFRIELAASAAKIAPHAGPLRLQVVASDTKDLSTNVTKEICLAKPDSVVLLADFESDRGYLGSKLEGIVNPPPKGEEAAHTTTAEHHSGKRSLEIQWDNDKHPTRYVAIDPPIPGVSIDVTMWVKGDGSGALFYPLIGGPTGVHSGLAVRNWNVLIPRVEGGELQDAVRLDFHDWRQFTFHFPPVPPNFDKALPVLHFIPAYPQGLHLGVDARNAEGDGGSIYVDDITIRTHLDPADRTAFALRRDSESNVIRPDAHLTFAASNYDATTARHAVISGGVYDWRGDRIAPIEAAVDLKPAETRDITLSQTLPPGAYELRVQMKEGEHLVGSVTQDVLVADLEPILGADWQTALKDKWKLRVPIRDDYTYLDEDWDWIEEYPGNVQTDSMRDRFMQVRNNGAKPWMLLGFSALWASDTSFQQMMAGGWERGYRDVGHGVDIFHIPERDSDWETYNIEIMRGVGNDVAGWVMWDNPDGTSSIALPPKRLASFIKLADKWRRVYCPKTPLIIGGMGRATAIPYLHELAKEDALSHISGVNVKMDVGRMSPEDSQVLAYANQLRDTLALGGSDPKIVLLTELDWAAEKSADGLNVFDQAAYLARSDLLLSRANTKPALNITNEDDDRFGTGLAYRSELQIPPMKEQTLTYNLKPGWWGMYRLRGLLAQLKSIDQIAVQDVTPSRTQAMLFARNADGRGVAIVWRNDNRGAVSFAHTGVGVESAEDIFGAAAPAKDGWYSIGKVPVIFTLNEPAAPARAGLGKLWVRDGAEPASPQRVIAQWSADAVGNTGYVQAGGTAKEFTGRTPTGELQKTTGVEFAAGGSETFSIDVPAGAGLILRKQYFLDKTGQTAAVIVNGKPVGTWNLKRSETVLSEGIRDAIYVIDASQIGGQAKARIEIKYDAPANTLGWTALEYRGGDFPLAAVGPVHADQQVGPIRLGRNMIGGNLKVEADTFADGIGAYANSLLEYPLNGQFTRFTAKVGVDAATEGRGSVIFEVWADGKKVWTSGIMSGLDRAKAIDVDVTGVNRLRLILNDAGDGNKFDAGDWCVPVLLRK